MHFGLSRGQGPRRPGATAGAAAGLLSAVLLLPLAAAFAQAPRGGELREARDRVLAGGDYQTALPESQQPPDFESFSIPPWLAELLYWAILAGVVALVLFFLGNLALDLLRDRGAFKPNRERRDASLRVEAPPVGPRAADAGSLAEADRLAAAGRFGEAIHLLLLVALARLHRELGPRIAPALTGREVLRLPGLPGDAAEPLAGMVQLSEINHFGGRAAAEPDYRRCRDHFLRFNGEAPVGA